MIKITKKQRAGAAKPLTVLVVCLALGYATSATAQKSTDDKDKAPKVYKSITKPKDEPSTDKKLIGPAVRKTVPITPSMKIPPHFPHPPAAAGGGGGEGEEDKKEEEKQPTPPATPPGGGGGSQPQPPPPPSTATGPGSADFGFDPNDEFAQGVKYKKKPKGFKFSFNIKDYDLADLVEAIAKITGKKFILSAKVKQNIKATIIAPSPVTAGEAFRAFNSVLEVNGLTVVPEGKFLKIVDSQGAAGLAVPTYLNGAATQDDRVITRIHKLDYGSSDELAQVLTKFKSSVGDVTSYAPTNSLIMTDYGSNLKRLMKIISTLDVPGTGEKIWVEPVHHGSADELAQKLQEVMEAAGMTGGKGGGAKGQPGAKGPKSPGMTAPGASGEGEAGDELKVSKIIPEDRTNSLIVVGTEGAYVRVIELLKKLDVSIPGEGQIHVHYLQHADAEELSNTLSSLTQGMKGRKGKDPGGGGATELFEGEIKITHDAPTNSLVIVSTLRDYNSLREVIDKLDIQRRQVFVEAIIMEVSLQKMKTLGVATHGGTTFETQGEDSLVFGASSFTGLSSILIDPTSLMGLAVGLRGPEISEAEGILGTGISIPAFGVMVNALQTNNDVNILSTPHILATDNEPAEITVGGNVPIQQGFGGWGSLMGGLGAQAGASSSALSSLGSLGGLGGLGPMVSVGRQNVGLTLKITPQINESDQIKLEIEIEISEVSGETSLGPLIDQRMAKTVSVVKDMQTVVIGGLITDNQTETIDKVPILGDIPVLGYLFKKKKTRNTKRNLLIFLTPYIIRDATDFRNIFNRKMEERREFIEQMTAFESQDYTPAVDYARTNGILEEIHKTMLEIEAEQKMLEELALKPPPEHKITAPIDVFLMEKPSPAEPAEEEEPEEDTGGSPP